MDVIGFVGVRFCAAAGHQEGGAAHAGRGHVHVLVAHHQANLGGVADNLQHLFEVERVRFGGPAILVSRDQPVWKIGHAGPLQPLLDGGAREERVSADGDVVTPVKGGLDRPSRLRVAARVLAQLGIHVGVKVHKSGLQLLAGPSQRRKKGPVKHRLVGVPPVVGHHGLAGLHQVRNELLGRYQVGHVRGQRLDINGQEIVNVYVQQCPVQIKENGFERIHCASCLRRAIDSAFNGYQRIFGWISTRTACLLLDLFSGGQLEEIELLAHEVMAKPGQILPHNRPVLPRFGDWVGHLRFRHAGLHGEML
jgi:hypothetical protein